MVWVIIYIFYWGFCLKSKYDINKTNYSFHGNWLIFSVLFILGLGCSYSIIDTIYSIADTIEIKNLNLIQQETARIAKLEIDFKSWNLNQSKYTSRSFELNHNNLYQWYKPNFRHGDWHTCNQYIYNYIQHRGIANINQLISHDFITFIQTQYPGAKTPWGYNNYNAITNQFRVVIDNLKTSK